MNAWACQETHDLNSLRSLLSNTIQIEKQSTQILLKQQRARNTHDMWEYVMEPLQRLQIGPGAAVSRYLQQYSAQCTGSAISTILCHVCHMRWCHWSQTCWIPALPLYLKLVFAQKYPRNKFHEGIIELWPQFLASPARHQAMLVSWARVHLR